MQVKVSELTIEMLPALYPAVLYLGKPTKNITLQEAMDNGVVINVDAGKEGFVGSALSVIGYLGAKIQKVEEVL